jgi:hypothetical protein
MYLIRWNGLLAALSLGGKAVCGSYQEAELPWTFSAVQLSSQGGQEWRTLAAFC